MKNKIEVLPPFPYEILFSWILRMSKWYGCNAFSNPKNKYIMMILFGEKCKSRPKLYVPVNLDYLVSAIDLPESTYFRSYVNIIENMSIFIL